MLRTKEDGTWTQQGMCHRVNCPILGAVVGAFSIEGCSSSPLKDTGSHEGKGGGEENRKVS